MYLINQLINTLFDIILIPFSKLHQFWGLFFISILSGLLLIYIFKITSNQDAIKRIKNKIKAHIFEIRLFDLNPWGLLKVLGIILKHNFRYISYSAVPLLFMLIPVLLILIQLNFRYGYRGHYPDETSLLKIYIDEDADIMKIEPSLDLKGQAVVDIGPMRNIPNNYIVYQLRVIDPKDSPIEILLKYQDQEILISKLFNNDSNIRKFSNKKPENSFFEIFLNPFEKPMDSHANKLVKEITVTYNENRISVIGIKFHFIVFFFIFSLIGGFAFKGLVGAEI